MFLRNFVKKTLHGMVYGGRPFFNIREYALGWLEKKVLQEEDLVELEGWITERERQLEEERKANEVVILPAEETITTETIGATV